MTNLHNKIQSRMYNEYNNNLDVYVKLSFINMYVCKYVYVLREIEMKLRSSYIKQVLRK